MKKKTGTSSAAAQESLSITEVTDHLIESAALLLNSDQTQAEDIIRRTITFAEHSGSEFAKGKSLLLLADLRQIQQNRKEAADCLKQAFSIFEKGNHTSELIHALRKFSRLFSEAGRFKEAVRFIEKALELNQGPPDPAVAADLLNSKGELLYISGDLTESVNIHLKALEQAETTGIRELVATTYCHIGEIYFRKTEYDAALSSFENATRMALEAGNKMVQSKALYGHSKVLLRLKETGKAQKVILNALSLVKDGKEPHLTATLLLELGKLKIEEKKFGESKLFLDEALLLSQKHSLLYILPEILFNIAELYAMEGDFQEAFKNVKEAVKQSEQLRELEIQTIAASRELDPYGPLQEHQTDSVSIPERFLLEIGHEIRTPLNGVLGMAGLLTGTHPTPEQLEYINTIKLSAGKLISYLEDAFEYQRLINNRPAAGRKAVALKELGGKVLASLSDSARSAGITVQIKVDASLPGSVNCESETLKDLLQKLTSHCIKNSNGGNITVSIEPLYGASTTSIRITATASAYDLTQEEINWKDNQKQQSVIPGNELIGVAILSKLTDFLGGSLVVEKASGSGARFIISLPIEKTGAVSPSGTQSGTGTKEIDLVHVLLVEDNKVNQFLAQKLLTKMGFSVSLASNASEAVDALQRERFDAILMDVQMPLMTGYELTELIRTTLPHPVNTIPIIALTAYDSPQERAKAREAGMNDFVTKPYSPEELKQVLLRATENRETSKAEGPEASLAEDISDTVTRLLNLFSGNTDDVVSLLNMLVVQIPQLINEASGSIEKEDWSACFQSFHKIRSSINLLKIKSLTNMIGELEEFSKDSVHADRIPMLFRKFSKSCEQAVGYLKEETVKIRRS